MDEKRTVAQKNDKKDMPGESHPPSLVTYIYNRIVRILTLIDNIGFSPDIFPFLKGFFNEHLLPRYVISEQWDTRCLSKGGGGVSPRKSVVQSACQYDVTSRVSDFQTGEQSFHRRDIKISILSRKYCSDFLDLEILRFLLSQKTRI